MKARIDAEGFVAEVVDALPPVTADVAAMFVDAPAGTTVGMVYDGTNFSEYTPPEVPVTTATKLKIMRTLKQQGQWASIKSALQANPDVEEEWLAAQDLNRNDPILKAFQATLGWADQQVDDLFKAAQ